MSRIQSCFASLGTAGKKALIPFITAGDPSREATVPLMHALAASGADIIELGVPFSDPMADGPVIQRSSERALKLGVGINDVLGYVEKFRKKDTTTPVVLFGYANPVERMGLKLFAAAAKRAGADGVLVVDYPPEEGAEFAEAMATNELDPIFLLAPTSPPARIAQIASMARGYIYYVSLKGVTGSASLDTKAVHQKIIEIKSQTALPVGVGFGIRDAETAAAIAVFADAVVIGSRLIQIMEESPQNEAIVRAAAFIAGIRAGMDGVASKAA